MRINIPQFVSAFAHTVAKLTEPQRNGLTSLLKFINADSQWGDPRQIVYLLATAYWETGRTFQPIEEWGKGAGRPYGKPDSVTGLKYFGRGYVQLTWRKNYQSAGGKLGIDLEHKPELALDPAIAYQIAARGMHEGWFTSKKLSDYIRDGVCDYIEARRIINGQDKAVTIAEIAAKIEAVLNTALEETVSPAPSIVPDMGRHPEV